MFLIDMCICKLMKSYLSVHETAANISISAPCTTPLELEQQAHRGGAVQGIAVACGMLEARPGCPVLIVCRLTKEVVP